VYFPVFSKLAVDVYTLLGKCNGAFDQLLTIKKTKISSSFIMISLDTKKKNNFFGTKLQ